MPVPLVQMIQSEPQKLKPEVKSKWKDLGPLNLMEVLEKTAKSGEKVTQMSDLHFGKPTKNFNFDIQGLIDAKNHSLCGIGRANYVTMLYEGQFKNNQ